MMQVKSTDGAVELGAASLSRIIEDQLASDPPSITLPWGWALLDPPGDGHGGPPVPDPLTIQVWLTAFGDDVAPRYRVTLGDLVKEMIEDGNAENLDEHEKAGLSKFAAELRKLADRIDALTRGDHDNTT